MELSLRKRAGLGYAGRISGNNNFDRNVKNSYFCLTEDVFKFYFLTTLWILVCNKHRNLKQLRDV